MKSRTALLGTNTTNTLDVRVSLYGLWLYLDGDPQKATRYLRYGSTLRNGARYLLDWVMMLML
ncbi:MAG TPA: hypothetical protein DEF01_04675 [Gemmatimonadetes bacterium]|nr:hypothetical protein [Gemmatimonadota bacterium]HBV06013.1 hypothetical protein [Gemmatimonadota bacterium]HCO14311.1 hypothetical protein [Gemmatimonadota bacterium]